MSSFWLAQLLCILSSYPQPIREMQFKILVCALAINQIFFCAIQGPIPFSEPYLLSRCCPNYVAQTMLPRLCCPYLLPRESYVLINTLITPIHMKFKVAVVAQSLSCFNLCQPPPLSSTSAPWPKPVGIVHIYPSCQIQRAGVNQFQI